MIIACVYIACQMLSDISSLYIVNLWGLSIDAGTFIYPLTFTLRDVLHKSIGKDNTKKIIILAGIINIIMVVYLLIVTKLPVDFEQDAFIQVFSPIWRITIASVLAEVISELVDTGMYGVWERKFGEKHIWGRVLFSNGISVPIDSIIFCCIAFLGVYDLYIVGTIIISNILIKYVMSIISIPMIYGVKEKRFEY